MAMPGRPILTLYDPSALRVTATIPQSTTVSLGARSGAKIELPGMPSAQKRLTPTLVTVLPTADPGTHTLQIRLDLPVNTVNVSPGMFARAWLPVQGAAEGRIFVPASAIVRRAEMTGAYVLDAAGKAALRQVRVGRVADESIEVLSGIAAGERVATDPQAAARMH
jgi:hypothetical protein